MTTGPFLIRVPSPIGRLELTSDEENILSLSIERDGHVPLEDIPERPSPVLEEAARQLGEYFSGARTGFELPVLFTSGSAFQRSVWNRLAGLGFGEVISYGALGVEVGKPGSARAIGGAVGANPIPIIVGCHRVLASNGRITGYSGGEGIPTKSWLLSHEGIPYSQPAPRRGAHAASPAASAASSTPTAPTAPTESVHGAVDGGASSAAGDRLFDDELELAGSTTAKLKA